MCFVVKLFTIEEFLSEIRLSSSLCISQRCCNRETCGLDNKADKKIVK